MIGAIIAWLVTCKAYHGSINVANLGQDYPMLAGNVTALGLSTIVTTVITFMAPDNFDWDIMRNGIRMIEHDGTDKLADTGEDSREGLKDALKCAFLFHPKSLCTGIRVCSV
jgi:urea-proton symporter